MQSKDHNFNILFTFLTFNTALLAKQIWRFISSPNLLVSRVVKAKYMRDKNWLVKQPANSASWTWKSIHSAGRVISKGLWKAVGDGESVDIWEDKWVAGSIDGRVTSVKPENSTLVKVSDLIEHGQWNCQIIQQSFNTTDGHLITSMPLSLFKRKDRLFWKLSKSGCYNVKAGYFVAKQELENQGDDLEARTETSWESDKERWWKKMWRLNIKFKQKHFLWKSLNNCLPVKASIKKRTGIGDHMCSSCGEAEETVEHVLFSCPIAEQVWKIAPIRWEALRECHNNFWKWWGAVLQSATKDSGWDHINLTVNILWQVWKARNKLVFEQKQTDARKIVQKAQVEWLEFDNANAEASSTSRNLTQHSLHPTIWEPPKEGTIRINTDAAISAQMVRTGKGIIARNWTGKIIKAQGKVEIKRGDAASEECLAIRDALMMARDARWTDIEVQSDCKSIVDHINSGSSLVENLRTVLEDIQELRRKFAKCSFLFVHRSGNQSSHLLARFAVKLIHDVQWDNEFPVWLIDRAAKDMGVVTPFCI